MSMAATFVRAAHRQIGWRGMSVLVQTAEIEPATRPPVVVSSSIVVDGQKEVGSGHAPVAHAKTASEGRAPAPSSKQQWNQGFLDFVSTLKR